MNDYREQNSAFYKSRAWRNLADSYMKSRFYICERCGRFATICHHKKHLNGENVNDPAVALNPDNLEALCQDCHNKEHASRSDRVLFDEAGQIKGRKESAQTAEERADRAAMAEVLRRAADLLEG